MKALNLTGSETTREKLLALSKEVPGARVGIKIAALLLVLEGQRPGRVTSLLGLNRMTLERCIRAVNQEGPQALVPKAPPGRPSRLTPEAQRRLEEDLSQKPQDFGLPRPGWDGPTLVVHLKEHFGVKMRVRQAERWMHKLGYNLKRASYTYIQARSEDAHKFGKELKKTEDSQAQ
jgi:transposase